MIALVILAATLQGLPGTAGKQVPTTGELLSCRTMKWTEVSLSAEGSTDYVLRLKTGDRDRQSVGAYTDQTVEVFWTNRDDGGHLRWLKNGSFEVVTQFTGEQPVNTSTVKLVGEPGSYEGESGYWIRLQPGKSSTKTNYAYRFFKERWTKNITGGGVLNDDQKTLFCQWLGAPPAHDTRQTGPKSP